jgi:DNA-binding response OmpR family regulator
MSGEPRILLFETDPAVAAALEFALGLDGFRVVGGDAAAPVSDPGACLVIDQRQPTGDGLALLQALREGGHRGAAVILATNPTRRFRERVRAAGATLVEKPLIGEALTAALRATLDPLETA